MNHTARKAHKGEEDPDDLCVLCGLCGSSALALCGSKFPAPTRRPPFHDDLLLGVEVDRVATLRVEVAEEAVLPARKWEVRHRRRHAHVDSDVSRASLVAELPRRGAAAREQTRHVPVG